MTFLSRLKSFWECKNWRSSLNGVSERDLWRTNLPFSRLTEVLYLREENCLQNAHFISKKGPVKKKPFKLDRVSFPLVNILWLTKKETLSQCKSSFYVCELRCKENVVTFVGKCHDILWASLLADPCWSPLTEQQDDTIQECLRTFQKGFRGSSEVPLKILYTEQMDAEGLGRKLLLTLSGDPCRAPEKQTVGTVTASHEILTLLALSSSLKAGTVKRGCLGWGEAFGCPPAVCPPKTAASICTYRNSQGSALPRPFWVSVVESTAHLEPLLSHGLGT